MKPYTLARSVGRLAALAACLGVAPAALALPKPQNLGFVAPTPGQNAVATSLSVRLDADCGVDERTLAVSLNGVAIPSAGFLPFSACSNGRMTSQTVSVPLSTPDTTITSGPTQINAGGSAAFSATGTGNELRWNFDGGAQPATGPSATATFQAAGRFQVRAQATTPQLLRASALDSVGNLAIITRDFKAGDPTPGSRQLVVVMPPDVDFRNFESGHVHPLALSQDGDQLFAVNTPEGRLEIFDVAPDGSLAHAASVPVGLDPVSLAVRPGSDEVWVANHLSDTVSVVDAAARRLVATLAVGDEPTDVVFASGRAFVSLAGREDRVKVYNAATRAQLASLALFGDDPRALAASADGSEVYAVVLESGNRTTALFTGLVEDGGGLPPPTPPRTAPGPAPSVGLIVQFDPADGKWKDDTGGDWSASVDYSLPDDDLFVIDADAATPSVVATVKGVGTTLFDVAVRPGTNQVVVANTDARNLVRFEPNLRGHLVETRLTVVNASSRALIGTVDLNPHINYAVTPGPASEIAASLSQPGDGVFSSDGSTYYLTAFGSSKVGVLDGAGNVVARIAVGGGPSGVALNEAAGRLYVLNRFDNTISLVDTSANQQVAVIGVAGPSAFDPSPDVIKAGRKFLYEGSLTSGHGDIACATCHVFGNFDNLAWDLGDPQGSFVSYGQADWVSFFILGASTSGFDPMKGPMTTQTLRGLKNHEPFHWRGDRRNFQHFNGAFVGLMGRAAPLSDADMNAYTDFIMTVNLPPNPFRNLNNTFPGSIAVPLGQGNPAAGQSGFVNANFDAGVFTCAQCHALPTGTNTLLFNGNAEGESQDFKIPQLRNMYEKVGFDVIRPNILGGDPSTLVGGPQKAGYGFLHDGSVSLSEFLAAGVFTMNLQQELDMFAFMLAFPTETAPAVGAQVTVTAATKNNASAVATINTLIGEAEAGRCDLVAKGHVGGASRGWMYDRALDLFVPDSVLETPLSEATLRSGLAGSDVLTYTGVPPGAGRRLGIDRDRDTWLDHSERVIGTDPANPNSNPWQASF